MLEVGAQVTFDVDGNKYADEESPTMDILKRVEKQKDQDDVGEWRQKAENEGKHIPDERRSN